MYQALSRYSAAVVRSGSSLIPIHTSTVKMSSNISSRYDLVIYGATGFTGQYVVEEVARVAEMEQTKTGASKPKLTWAVAGRNKSKLLKSIEEAKKETGLSLSGVGVLEADVADLSSVDAMTKQARVLINCVGPYVKYGEPVVKACISNGADHVDISGEPLFLEGMQLKYDKEAREKGVHIVGACGYDSIPAEMGLVKLSSQFPGGLCSAEMYGSIRNKSGRHAPVNTGTLESALHALATKTETAAQKRKLFPTRMAKPKFRMPSRKLIHHNDDIGCYGIPFPSDMPVVYRTQRHRHDELGLQPVQFQQYLASRSWIQAAGTTVGLIYFLFIGMFSWTRNLVLKYPSVLTGGFFSRGGAEKEALKGLSLKTVFVGQGWTEKLADPADQHTAPPNAKKILTICGPDPAYAGTSLMMVASAMTLLREKDKLSRCGVVTPGFAFEQTSLISRLQDRGMTFDLADK